MKDQEKALLDLFTSRVRLKILGVFLPNPESMFYVRELTRMVDEEVNAVRRELERMKEIGLLRTESRGNRLYYKVRTDFIFYYDLLKMIGKTTGLGAELLRKEDELGNVKFAVLTTRFVRGSKAGSNDIDVLIVGKVNLDVLQQFIRAQEDILKREINYTVMTEDEFEFRKKRGDAFVKAILTQPQVVLIGDEEELNQ